MDDNEQPRQLRLIYANGLWFALNVDQQLPNSSPEHWTPSDYWVSGVDVDHVLRQLYEIYGYSAVLTLVQP